jgi:hypothetical protein
MNKIRRRTSRAAVPFNSVKMSRRRGVKEILTKVWQAWAMLRIPISSDLKLFMYMLGSGSIIKCRIPIRIQIQDYIVLFSTKNYLAVKKCIFKQLPYVLKKIR